MRTQTPQTVAEATKMNDHEDQYAHNIARVKCTFQEV